MENKKVCIPRRSYKINSQLSSLLLPVQGQSNYFVSRVDVASNDLDFRIQAYKKFNEFVRNADRCSDDALVQLGHELKVFDTTARYSTESNTHFR